MALSDRACPACTPSTPPATTEQVTAWSAELDRAWEVLPGRLFPGEGPEGPPPPKRLVRSWRFADFAAALAFTNRVGAVAETAGHHPEITVGWGRVRVELWTHAIGGLSEADFVVAARLDALR